MSGNSAKSIQNKVKQLAKTPAQVEFEAAQQPKMFEEPTTAMKIGSIADTVFNAIGDAYNTYNSLLGDTLNAVHNGIKSNNKGFSDPYLFASALAAGAKARGIVGSVASKAVGNMINVLTGGGELGNLKRAYRAELLSKMNNIDSTKGINGGQLGEIRKIKQGNYTNQGD